VNISNTTKSEIDSLIASKWIIRGKTYKISGCDFRLYENGTNKNGSPVYTSIYLTGLENNKLSETGIGEFYTPKYSDFSKICDESSKYSYPEDVEINSKEIDAYPNDESPNILFYNETLRGTIINYTIESDIVPNPKEFALTAYYLETPNDELELVDKMFYKGSELQRYFDFENYRTKDLKVEVFTLKDI
jgi:hypothetical protein